MRFFVTVLLAKEEDAKKLRQHLNHGDLAPVTRFRMKKYRKITIKIDPYQGMIL
jgi:hypothetical protein